MQFKHIIKNLKEKYPITVISEQNVEKIRDIRLLDPLQKKYETDILYLGDKQAVLSCKKLPLQLITTHKPSCFSIEGNLALIDSNDFSSFFNTLHTLFYQSLQISSDFSQLIAMSIRGDSPKAIINEAAKKLGNPIIVIDNGFKVLFYSDIYEIQDELWKDNIKRGYCTYEFITAVNQISNSLDTPTNSSAYTFSCPASPHSKLCSKIIWNHSQIGYTIMLEEQTPYNLIQQELLPHISYVLSDLLSKMPEFGGIHGSLKNILLYQLLDKQDTENIAIRIKHSGFIPPKNMCCITLIRDTLLDEKQWERFALEQLQRIFPNDAICIYDNHLVILAACENSFHLKNELLSQLQNLLPKVSKNIYMSQIFDDIYQTHFHYRQCMFLKEFALKMNFAEKILSYDDYQFYDLLEQLPDKSALYDYISLPLRKLLDYDRKNNTCLFETLETYIQCQYNATKTAAALFIHRNSLTYRMEKIEELTHIDFNNANQLFHLSFGFYIKHYITHVQNE